jgi:hypothetical protein
LSLTIETDFCVEALQESMSRYGKPEIFNTDQGVQFTAAAFIETLAAQGVRISMDGKGRFLDNIFIERLWRSLKYEEVFLKAYTSVAEARRGIGAWMAFYNDERKHQSLGYRTPSEIFVTNPATFLPPYGPSCVDVIKIQRFAGHENISRTMKYINTSDENLRDVVDSLASNLGRR